MLLTLLPTFSLKLKQVCGKAPHLRGFCYIIYSMKREEYLEKKAQREGTDVLKSEEKEEEEFEESSDDEDITIEPIEEE